MALNTSNTSDNYFTAIQQEYKILAEYKMIQFEDVGGIYVIPSHNNSFLWFGVIFVRSGLYKDAIFRFNISLPDNFPNDSKVPSVIFQNTIYHPLICPYKGTLLLSDAFPTWETGTSHIWQILKFIKYIFTYPLEYVSSLVKAQAQIPNKEAANILLSPNKQDEFLFKVKECVQESCEGVYNPPPTADKHYITFEKFNPDIHGPTLQNIKKNKELFPSTLPPVSGISWVREGEYKPLSKD